MKFATEAFALVALLSAIPLHTCNNISGASRGSQLKLIPYQSANCKDVNGHQKGNRTHPKDLGSHSKDQGGHRNDYGHLQEGHSPPPYGKSHPSQTSGTPHKQHHSHDQGVHLPHNTCVGFPLAKSYRAVLVTHPGDPYCQLSIFTGSGCLNEMRTISELGGKKTCFDTNLPYGWLGGGSEASWSAYYYCDGTT